MTANSFNLVEFIRGYLTGNVVGRLSSTLGENMDTTRAGILAAVPGLLAGLNRAASTPDGARRITSAVDDADEGVLDNMMQMFSGTYSSESGSGILRSIMGAAGLSALANNVGRVSGLSGKSSASMIGLLAPVLFSILRKARRTAGMERFDIPSLLASQRSNIESAMPEGMVEETYAGPRVASRNRVIETDTRASRHAGTSWLGWLLPLALLALALGLIWNWAGQTRRDARFATPRTAEAGREAGAVRPRTMLTLDALKDKYRSVLREAQVQGINISELRTENGKLVIKGTAPSQEAANKVWSEIRRVNPTMDDITADFSVAAAPQTTDQPSSKSLPHGATQPLTGTGEEMYTVRAGDTLGSISKHFYGNPNAYARIFNANRDEIADKDLLRVGQKLRIPMD